MTSDDKPGTHFQNAITAMRPAIDALYRQYEGLSQEWVAEQDMPQAELEAFLDDIDIKFPNSSHRRLKLAIWEFITRMACFKYRVISKCTDGQVKVWNPLEEPLKQFVSRHPPGTIVYRANDEPYPTADLISDWVSTHLREPLGRETPMKTHAEILPE